MAMQMFKEQLNGKYNGVAPATLLGPGGVSGGKNMRKVSAAGGWKARKGVTIHNTTAIAAASVLSLHQFTHPRNLDYHFIAQCNGNLYDSSGDPPAAGGTTFAAAALTALAGTGYPGWSDTIGEKFLYADGDGAPVMWGGDAPYPEEILFYDNSVATSEGKTFYTSYTRDLTDNSTSTSVTITLAASDKLYVASPCRAKGIIFDLGTSVNNNAAVATVKGYQNGAWAAESTGFADGTIAAGASLAVDGTMAWTMSANDDMSVIQGRMAYWYEISWDAALDAVEIISIKLTYDPERLSNKWSGVYETPLAVRFYDQSAGQYIDYSGKLTNESTAQYIQLGGMTTSDELLVKTVEPITGIGFGVVDGYPNTDAALIDKVYWWDGDSYESVDKDTATDGVIDETKDAAADSSFAQTGVFWWSAADKTPRKRTYAWDSTPGYWYKVVLEAALDLASLDCRVYIVTVAAFPPALPAYKGVIEFKGRAFVWPDPEYPNRLRYSANGRPDCFSGRDSRYTDEFGDKTEIVACRRFANELIVWKRDSVWMLEGFSPDTFGTLKIADTVGCVAPKTTQVIETGYPSMHADEPLSIALWMDTDGVYILDGRKPRKISLPIDQYFNFVDYSSTAFVAAKLGSMQSYVDKLNNEYHLLPQTTTELVYNFITDEWYPPWIRRVGAEAGFLVCGLGLEGTDNRNYSYGANDAGFVFRLESDTTDKDATNADVAIEQRVKTRAISAEQKQSTTLEFTFRKAFIEAKARSSGTVTTNFYKNIASSGTAISVPAAISLVNSGYELVVDGVELSQTNCLTFQLEFVESTADVELEIHSFLYLLDIRGEART